MKATCEGVEAVRGEQAKACWSLAEVAGYEANGRSARYSYYACRRARKKLGGSSCPLGNLRVEHLDGLVCEALAVLGRHPVICRATADATLPQNSPTVEKHKAQSLKFGKRINEIESLVPSIEELVRNKSRPALAERMMDEMEALLSEKRKLEDEKRVLDAKVTFETERATNVEAVAKALEQLPQIFAALPEKQRQELMGLLVRRIVVKPYADERVGFEDAAVAIAPVIGTRRFFVKISIYEKALLSAAFTASVDGSTFEKIGCGVWMVIRKIGQGNALRSVLLS